MAYIAFKCPECQTNDVVLTFDDDKCKCICGYSLTQKEFWPKYNECHDEEKRIAAIARDTPEHYLKLIESMYGLADGWRSRAVHENKPKYIRHETSCIECIVKYQKILEEKYLTCFCAFDPISKDRKRWKDLLDKESTVDE